MLEKESGSPAIFVVVPQQWNTMNALAHSMRDPCTCGIEGIIYVEPYYRPIICVPVSVGSPAIGEGLALGRVISHAGRGMVRRWWCIDRDRDLSLGKFRAVADIIEIPVHHRTRHQDYRRRRSESHFYVSVHLQRRSGRPTRPLGGVLDAGSARFTMDGLTPRWMGLRLIVDSFVTDGPQQTNLTPRRTPLTLASLC